MSFILDALKKAEAERQRQTGPTLLEVRITPPRRRFPLWMLIIGGLLGVNILLLGFFALRRPVVVAAAPSAPATLTPAATPAPPVAVAPAAVAPAGSVPTVPATAAAVAAAAPAGAPMCRCRIPLIWSRPCRRPVPRPTMPRSRRACQK